MAGIEVSANVGAFIAHAAAAGVDLQRATGFDPDVARDPDARIPLALETTLWDEAARLAGDDSFGLHAALLLRPGAFDVLDYAVRTAPTLRASLQRLARYNRLVHDAAEFTLIPRGENLRVEHALRVAGTQSRHAAEFTLASLVVIGGQIAGAPVLPRGVEFRHPAPQRTAEHERIFGLQPRFLAAVNAIEFENAALEELRRELSLRYLLDPKIAIAEVAYLVGYLEPSAFHRAFKRWTGKTPAEARHPAA